MIMAELFVYGTLQNDEIVRALTGRVFKKQPYKLFDYKVLQVSNEHFPGMIKAQGANAAGYILSDVDENSLAIIDKWEGDDYAQIKVKAILNGTNTNLIAYVWKKEDKLSGSWSNSVYRDSHMAECVKICIPKEFGKDLLT